MAVPLKIDFFAIRDTIIGNMSSREVQIESVLGGFTATAKLHTLSVWFILALRLMMGLAFFQSGLDKVLSGGFSAGGT